MFNETQHSPKGLKRACISSVNSVSIQHIRELNFSSMSVTLIKDNSLSIVITFLPSLYFSQLIKPDPSGVGLLQKILFFRQTIPQKCFFNDFYFRVDHIWLTQFLQNWSTFWWTDQGVGIHWFLADTYFLRGLSKTCRTSRRHVYKLQWKSWFSWISTYNNSIVIRRATLIQTRFIDSKHLFHKAALGTKLKIIAIRRYAVLG